ncbi:MAG TPA: hypothetical protein VFQ51_19440, partial [Vicinamibacteria bacterium]|nr:hypothetical protein [Vicinamibacteria bacterium]
MRPRSLAKLTAPQAEPVVPRASVAAAIDRALRRGICWIAAPAGYGKTTALADFVRRRRRPHVWYRVDEGDRDVASVFHHLARALPRTMRAARLPVFGPEYADQPRAFARRFFRAWFQRVPDGTLLVLDDLQDADTPEFREVLSVLLAELPDTLACACLSRTRPPAALDELALRARLTLLEQEVLEFSTRDARLLIARRAGERPGAIDPDLARGWAAGLVLIAERAAVGHGGHGAQPGVGPAVFTELAGHWLEGLEPRDQDALMELSLLPEITSDLARALTGGRGAGALLTRLRERQLLVTGSVRGVFRLHDLLRGFLLDRLAADRTPAALARLRQRVAVVLERAGRGEDAVELALSAGAWTLARRLVLARAEALLARGQRATLIRWCSALPDRFQEHPWLCYWLGVAHMSDDAAAESWLARAWSLFREEADADGLRLTAACAVLSKTDSWRTHEGLAVWTKRALDLLADGGAGAEGRHDLLVWSGMLRAIDFAEDYHTDAPAVGALRARLLARLRQPLACDAAGSRLIASETLVEHAGSLGRADVFEQAVDSVTAELQDAGVSPWIRGMWLVAFGAVSGRYFPYARRGFPHASAEDALRAAVEIGRREGLRAVEFGALYHLQLLLKLRNDLEGFGALVERLAEIADSRYTTQVAVLADCQAALHTLQGRLPEAYRACERFTMAIEAANEPPIERWPHFVTEFQVRLADRRPREAAAFLRGW